MASKPHKVWHVRESVPGDPGHPEPPFSPRKVCVECGKAAYHTGRTRGGTPWVHGEPA